MSDEDLSPTTLIQRFEGSPKSRHHEREATRWDLFVQWICPWLSNKHELAEEFLSATVAVRTGEAELKKAEAEKKAQETAELAARTDSLRQEGVQKFFDLLDALESPNSELINRLKLAKLLEANPGVADQLNEILKRQEELFYKHGTTVDVVHVGLKPEMDKQQISGPARE